MRSVRKIYYDKATGNVIYSYLLRGYFIEPTEEQDFMNSLELQKRDRETVGLLRLDGDEYAQDFAECNGYRVNPETLQIEFSHPDPNEPEAPPVYRKPLSEEIAETKQAIAELTILIAQLGGV